MPFDTPDGSERESCRRVAVWLRDWPLIISGCFAVIWTVHRAVVQSITLDEANTFLHWVAREWPAHWIPQANNHVLNSELMRLFIWLFGLSHLTVRAPALIGGVLYIVGIHGFCTLVSRERVLTWALFVCFVYNPFVMDYLVAARGYGLALGFLSLAMWVLARALVRLDEPEERDLLNEARIISACAALSFCANFSFGYADGFLLAAFLAWACVKQRGRGGTAYARLAVAGVFPAVVLVLVLAGPVLTRFRREQLIWGTNSLAQTWQDMRDASFAPLNEYLVNPLLAHLLRAAQQGIVIAAVIAVAAYLVLLLFSRGRYFEVRSRLRLAGTLAAVLVLTLAAHWLQFQWMKIPLPFERTSLFFVPLGTAIAGVVLSVTPSNTWERVVRGFGVGVLCVTGVYFIGALRDSYFREWKICADLEDAFPVIVELCRKADVYEVATDMNYPATLNFYRTLYRVTDIDEFADYEKMPPGRPIYVLEEHSFAEFIRKEGLQVAYHGRVSDLVVVVRPGINANMPK